jgi:dienelactone hydrolase
VDRGHRRRLRGRARLPRLRLRRLRRAGARAASVDRIALEPDRHAELSERDHNTLNNYADIAAIRLRASGGQLLVSFEMNSLFDANDTVGGARDRHRREPRRPAGARGADLVAFPDIPGARSSARERGLGRAAPVLHGRSRDEPDRGAIPLPPGAHWRLQAAAAVASTRTVMNVAFRGTGETGAWFEDAQAAALQTGDISAFGYTIEVAKLTGGVTEPAVIGPGYYERVYTSDYTIAVDGGQFVYDTGAEGVNYDGIPGAASRARAGAFAQEFHFVGRNQPYGIFVPSAAGPHGMQLALHGFSANHTSLIASANPLHEGLQQNVGEALDRILVVPLGRGPAGFYSDISERDVLDVMADVEANYPVDRDRVYSGGYSMGGYGTLRMATTYPDRFAGYLDWVGYPGRRVRPPDIQRCEAGEVGIPAEWIENLREVDGAMLYSGADELVNSAQGLWLRGLFAAVGYPHIFYYHPAAEHLHVRARSTTGQGGDVLDDRATSAPHAAAARHLSHRRPTATARARHPPRPRLLGLRDREHVRDARRTRLRRRRRPLVRLRRRGAHVRRRRSRGGHRPSPWESQSVSVAGSTPIAQQKPDRGDARPRRFVRDRRFDQRRLHPSRPAARLSRRDRRHRRRSRSRAIANSHSRARAPTTASTCPSPPARSARGGRRAAHRTAPAPPHEPRERGRADRRGRNDAGIPHDATVRRHGSFAVGLSPTFAFVIPIPLGWAGSYPRRSAGAASPNNRVPDPAQECAGGHRVPLRERGRRLPHVRETGGRCSPESPRNRKFASFGSPY